MLRDTDCIVFYVSRWVFISKSIIEGWEITGFAALSYNFHCVLWQTIRLDNKDIDDVYVE